MGATRTPSHIYIMRTPLEMTPVRGPTLVASPACPIGRSCTLLAPRSPPTWGPRRPPSGSSYSRRRGRRIPRACLRCPKAGEDTCSRVELVGYVSTARYKQKIPMHTLCPKGQRLATQIDRWVCRVPVPAIEGTVGSWRSEQEGWVNRLTPAKRTCHRSWGSTTSGKTCGARAGA